MTHEKKLASLADLNIVATLTPDRSRRENRQAILRCFQVGPNSITEPDGFFHGSPNDHVRSEGHYKCFGSLAISKTDLLMTHTLPGKIIRDGSIYSNLGAIEQSLRYFDNGEINSVIWERQDPALDNSQNHKEAQFWKKEILQIYSRFGVNVLILTFEGFDWPMSAYYNGAAKLTLVANQDKKDQIFHPQTS